MIVRDVKTDMTWEVVKMKKPKIARSLDGWVVLPDDGHGVRSRCVAQQVNNGRRDDVYAGAYRRAAKCSDKKAGIIQLHQAHRCVSGTFISRAQAALQFFLKDVYAGEHLWYLNKAMNGTREARKQWVYVVDSSTSGGFHVVKSVPGLYFHPVWMVALSCQRRFG